MFFRRDKKVKRDWAVGLDFGMSQVRGVLIRRKDTALKLEAFDVRPLNTTVGQAGTIPAAAATVAQLFNGWNTVGRCAFVAINPPGAIISQTELPPMPLTDARAALRLNQRNLSNCYFDLVEHGVTADKLPNAKNTKMHLLVGAATREEVLWYRDVMRAAKVQPLTIELSTLTIVNGLLVSEPEICQNETVLLLDLRANTTAMIFLRHSQLLFTYVMYSGSRQITEHLALKMNLDFAAADELRKSAPVEEYLQLAIAPLARELCATIDFFDRQHDCRVSRVLACGGTDGLTKTLELLGKATGIHIEVWNCLQHLDPTLTQGGDRAQLPPLAPELAAAVGAALARLKE